MQKPQLFLIHFAGGSCYSFEFLTSQLKEFDAIPIELPGRGKRILEKLIRDFDVAATDVLNQINKKLTADKFIVYGHSMGAMLALRVCNLLEKQGKIPSYLIVSGNAGPGLDSDHKLRYLLNKEEFVEELNRLGGMPPALLENQELFDFFEPILRADFEVSEKKKIVGEPAIRNSLFAIMGSEEEEIDKISNWDQYTLSSFDYEILDGDHFFIYKHPQRIATIIRNCYRQVMQEVVF
jgi:external thioesterase TEII